MTNSKLIFLSMSLMGSYAHAMELTFGEQNELNERLLSAIWRNDLNSVQFFLDSGAEVNCKSVAGTSALEFAACKGNVSILECLLNRGADIDLASYLGFTPLMRAVTKGHDHAARYLLERGADMNKYNPQGETALIQAAGWDKQSCCELLVEAMLELTPAQKKSIYATLFCVKPIQGISYPIAERFCEAFLCENKIETRKAVDKIRFVAIKQALLEKYFEN